MEGSVPRILVHLILSDGGGAPVLYVVGYEREERGGSPEPRHVVLGPGLVDEDEMGGVQLGEFEAPKRPEQSYIRPLLLRGVDDFF